MMEYLKRVKITILAVVLVSCVLCGAMTAGVKPALAALAPLAEEICSVTWGAEPQPTGVTLRVNIECPWLMQLRPINRLHLSPIDRKW
jgi:hypothetical protein